jgi:hypothetical protein
MTASAHVVTTTHVDEQEQQEQQSQADGLSDDASLFDEFALATAAAAARGGGSGDTQKQQAAGGQSRDSSDGQHSADPVTWFSALPPASLKAAQASFRGALQQAVEAANAGQRLRQHMAQLEQLGGDVVGVGELLGERE